LFYFLFKKNLDLNVQNNAKSVMIATWLNVRKDVTCIFSGYLNHSSSLLIS